MARPLPPSERSSESPLVLTTRVDGVDIDIDPPLLRVDLRGPTFGVSPERVDPLWHRPDDRPAFTVELTSVADGPRVVTLRNRTEDSRFHAGWTSWTFAERAVMESEGGHGAEAQDVAGSDGSLTLLLRPGERRRARLEFDVSLVKGLEPSRILHRLQAFSGGETGELTSHLLLEHPDSKLLAMLPGIYQEAMADMRAELSAPDLPFFERYLVGLQDAIDPLREALHKLDALFGPYSSPPDYLVWLASWVCMPMDANWPEMKRRRLISEAVELFRWRGTKRGLSRFLEIYTGVRPIIQDRPQKGAALGGETLMGDAGTIIGDVPDYTFTVTLGVPNPAAVDEEVVHRIIQSEKPAHTAYRLLIVRRDAKGRI